MSFLDPWFYLCLLLALPVYWLTPSRFRMSLLLAATGGWLAYASETTLGVFVALGVFAWLGGVWISKGPNETSRNTRKWIASGSVIAFAVLARIFFKDMFGGLTLSVQSEIDEALKLFGFAYVVLKVHHYFVIAKATKSMPLSFFQTLHFLLYIPTISAGPILRVREFKPLEKETQYSPEHFEVGIKRIALGLVKKVFVVLLLLQVTQTLWPRPEWWIQPVLLLLSVFTIYFDFSGYTDIAIGIARLFGHKVPENFKNPFSATSLSQFWRKWHITMGDWIREHIFIPMGGMRASKAKIALILFTSMIFCGIWHAFEWRFVAWGLYHGTLITLEQAMGIHPLPPNAPRYKKLIRQLVILAIMSGSVIFFIPQYWT